MTMDAYLAKNKCLFRVDGRMEWNKNHQYYYKIQLQMLLSVRNFADFVIWRAGVVSVIRTEIDLDFLQEEIKKAEVIVSELLAGFYTKKKKIQLGKLSQFTNYHT
jgi:hypothetical protein